MNCALKMYGSIMVRPADEIIEDFLYLGSKYDYGNHEKLLSLGITHILDISRQEIKPCNMDNILSLFKYVHLEVNDSPDYPIYKYFERSVKLLDEVYNSGGKVLVNCFMGKSRSATIVINYIMEKTGLPLNEAYGYVLSKREVIEPNIGFLTQLHIYSVMRNITKKE